MSARRLFPAAGLHGAYVLLVTSVVRADLQFGVDIAMKLRVELGHFVHPHHNQLFSYSTLCHRLNIWSQIACLIHTLFRQPLIGLGGFIWSLAI